MKELVELTKLSPGSDLEKIQDGFSKELIKLWKVRKLQGRVFQTNEGDKPVGYLLLETAGLECTIRGFFVDKRYRGQGIGTKLLERCLEFTEATERYDIYVNISEGAEKTYKRCGFQILGTRKDFPDQKLAYRGPRNLEEVREKLKKKLK